VVAINIAQLYPGTGVRRGDSGNGREHLEPRRYSCRLPPFAPHRHKIANAQEMQLCVPPAKTAARHCPSTERRRDHAVEPVFPGVCPRKRRRGMG